MQNTEAKTMKDYNQRKAFTIARIDVKEAETSYPD